MRAQQLHKRLDHRVGSDLDLGVDHEVSGRKMVTPWAISRLAVAARIVASSATSSAYGVGAQDFGGIAGLNGHHALARGAQQSGHVGQNQLPVGVVGGRACRDAPSSGAVLKA